jgi:hypothetical protein
MVSAIIFWFKADYCSAIMSHDGLMWCFKGWVRLSYLCNRSNTIHMTTYVLQRLNIFYILLKIRAFFIITLFSSSGYVRELAFYSHWENTSITLPFYLEGRFGPTFYWSACSKICICVCGIDFASLICSIPQTPTSNKQLVISCWKTNSCMRMFCKSLLHLLPFIVWSLCYLSCFDLQILNTSLVSSNSYLLIFVFWLWVSLIKIVQDTHPAY